MLTSDPDHDLTRLQADLDENVSYDEDIADIQQSYEDYKTKVINWINTVRLTN